MDKLVLPPEQSGYSAAPGVEAVYTELDGGLGRYRQDILGAAARVTASWLLNPTDYRYMVAFYHSKRGGALPFLIDLVLDSNALTEYTAHFVPGTWKVTGVEGQSYRVAADLEVTPTIAVDYTAEQAIVTARNP